MIPTCQELADRVASGEVEHLGWLERLRHRLHGWLCPPCRRYVQQVDSIGALARDRAEAVEPTDREADAMRRRCLDRLKARGRSPAPGDGDAACRGSD
ncbi:MAG: hypothetical protein AAGF23_14075 [Acidobacteriota bacterium]